MTGENKTMGNRLRMPQYLIAQFIFFALLITWKELPHYWDVIPYIGLFLMFTYLLVYHEV